MTLYMQRLECIQATYLILNEETFAWLREQTAWERTVAVGEIGLDYYWDKEPKVQENQRYWFKRQLELAAEAIAAGYHPLA